MTLFFVMSATPTPPAAGTAPVPTSAPPATAPASSTSVIGDALALDAKPAATESGKPAEKPAESTPAPIELKLPEGFTADKAALEGFTKTASELGLDSAKAQKLFDQYVSLESARTAAAEKAFADQDAKWVAAVKADPDIGGERLQKTIVEVNAALKWLGADVGELIKAAGLGNHPEMLRGLVKLGRGLADDTIKGTSKPGASKAAPKSDAEIF